MPYCNNCGKEIDANAKFCGNCGQPYSPTSAPSPMPPVIPAPAKPTTWTKPFPMIGGVLALVASCLLIVSSILSFILWFEIYYLINAIIGIIAFSFGLTASIMSIKKRNIYLSITGLSLLVASGAMTLVAFAPIGIPILVLAIIGLIFVALGKAEFH